MAEDKKIPKLTKDLLVDLGGWAVLKEARSLIEANAVKSYQWDTPVLKGEIMLGGMKFAPQLNLRSVTFAENKCNCLKGRQGYVCAHAIALCIKANEEQTVINDKEQEVEEKTLEIKSLKISLANGRALQFRIILPPNLKSTACKDNIILKIEALVGGKLISLEQIDRGLAYSLKDSHYKVGALIEDWCKGKMYSILRVSRSQLKELLKYIENLPVVFWANNLDMPISWVRENELKDVHCLLEEEASSKDSNVVILSDTRKVKINIEDEPITPIVVDGAPSYLAITLPSKNSEYYQLILDLLNSNHFKLEPSNKKWWLRDRFKVLEFLSHYWRSLKEEWNADFTDNFTENMKSVEFVEVSTSVNQLDDVFELHMHVSVDAVSEAELENCIKKNNNYIETESKIYIFDQKHMQTLKDAQSRISNNPSAPLLSNFTRKLKVAELAVVENCLKELGINFEPPESWQDKSKALQNISALELPPMTKQLDDKLRNYQRIGVAWLWHLRQSGLGGILADEMGLGKTVQSLAFLDAIHNFEKGHGPFFVVCPAGLVENWLREARTFIPNFTCFVHHRFNRLMSIDEVADYDLIITSYSTLSQDLELFEQIDFSVVIADEAQHIKNIDTRNARAIRNIRAKNRFLLTGTPVENRLEDLVSLFEFLMPGYLSKTPKGVSNDEKQWYQENLLKQVAPYILRRSKRLVAPELPDKIEQVIYCEMSPEQTELYRSVKERCQREIFEMEMANMSENKVRFAALNQLLKLRQVCTEPRLVNDKLDSSISTKLKVFNEILEEAIDGGHRILVFSQFVSLLKLLEKDLIEQGVNYSYLDGSTRNRMKVCDEFNKNTDIPVFLISLKAGGVGLNLTGANIVVHFDPWWNPAIEDQATDRAHRIGQVNVVTSIKLIVKDSVEEKVLELQNKKAKILRDLLDASSDANLEIGLSDIKDLIGF